MYIKENIKDTLTQEEFERVTSKNNFLGASILLFDWIAIAGIFYLVAVFPNPITILIAIILLGGRQLGLGVIVHETGHRTLFSSRKVNDFVGNWLAGYWVFSGKQAYMKGHLVHHKDAGTDRDPDLPNYRDYPVSRTRIRRKITRDVTGQVGWRRMKSIGRSILNIRALKPQSRQTVYRSLLLNGAMLALLASFGNAWLYSLWVIAFMTSHMLVTRIRQIAEHAAVPNLYDLDPRLNTRTIYISWLERLLIAPHHVSYHLEHHLMASVPIYRLQELHEILLKKGYYKGVDFPKGYLNLLAQVTY